MNERHPVSEDFAGLLRGYLASLGVLAADVPCNFPGLKFPEPASKRQQDRAWHLDRTWGQSSVCRAMKAAIPATVN